MNFIEKKDEINLHKNNYESLKMKNEGELKFEIKVN